MNRPDHTECEQQLEQAHLALMRSEQLALAGRFAGAVMHEVNNPLEALGNLVYLADQSAGDPEVVRRYLNMAAEQLARVQEIARRTLSFYRLNAIPEEVDVVQLLDCALHMQRPQLRMKSIAVCRNDEGRAAITANAGELLQVFTNLIANSVEALPDAGTLHLRVSRSRDHVHILIADNGKGIPAEQRDRLFQPFASSNKEKGTGLGLWMSKTLVERHRGWIRHRSNTTPGRTGTAFRVSLPR
ncbi:MAG: hypothetical protein NVSMB3_05000 [Acidobacteriaceae bacterium]